MAVTAADVRKFVGASSSDDPTFDELLLVAGTLYDGYVEDAVTTDGAVIPAHIEDRAKKLIAAELWTIDNAPNGVLNQQFDGPDGTQSVPVRVGTDPLRPVYQLLAQWVGPVIA